MQNLNFIYANEADILNVALFGMTAKEFREKNPDKQGNLRDFATVEQLVVLSNLESLNSVLIEQGLPPEVRIVKLNEIAISQIRSLLGVKQVENIKSKDKNNG